MAAGPPTSLNNGPPLPPNLQPQAQPSMGQLAGPPQQGAPSGSASLQQVVIQKLMFVEQTLNDIAQIMPNAAGPVDGIINMLRKGMGSVLAQGAQPPVASSPMMPAGASMMGPGGMGNAPSS